jgi:heme/copper-type cytochrome/quinol oxidase subunit 3
LVGTCILLASGFVLTYGHHAFILGDKSGAIIGVFLSIVLGIAFVYMQYTEYNYSQFTIADSVLGSVFYM